MSVESITFSAQVDVPLHVPVDALDVDGYAARLAAVMQELGDPARSASDHTRAVEELAEIDAVVLASGETLTPDGLHELVAVWDPQTPEATVARLGVILEQLEQAGSDQSEIRLALLREVLARPVFLEQETWLDRIRRWIEAWLRSWFPDWEPSGAGIPPELVNVLGWIVVVAASLALIWLASYWLQGILSNLRGADALLTDAMGDAVPATASAARQQAQSAAAAGDYRQAVRRLYLAALLVLDEHGLLRFDPSQTNREVLASIPPSNPINEPLQAVVNTFDAVWYGIRIPDETTYQRYAADIDALERAARTPASARGSERGEAAPGARSDAGAP